MIRDLTLENERIAKPAPANGDGSSEQDDEYPLKYPEENRGYQQSDRTEFEVIDDVID